MWAWSVGVGRQLSDLAHDVIQTFVSVVIALVAIFILIFYGLILEQKQPLKRIQFALVMDVAPTTNESGDQNPNVGSIFEKVFIFIGANA